VFSIKDKLSDRASVMKASEIREILKLTQKPDMISFAGGLPNPLSFPVDKVKEIVNDLLKNDPGNSLQYGTTEGITPLREELAKMARSQGMEADMEDILVVHGSQQGLDLMGRIFLNAGDNIMVGAPTYLGANSVWRECRAKVHEVTVDDDGIEMDEADETLHRLRKEGALPKLFYLMSNFHNPAGITLSEKRRKQAVSLAHEYDLVIIEDDPYGQIRFEGKALRPIKHFDDEGRVIYTSTFSKLLAPGFRIAWCTASKEILHKLVLAKQSADLCTNAFGQFVTYEYMARGYFKAHVPKIISLYKEKCGIMLKSMDEHFPEEVQFTRPKGGMFSWATFPDSVDTLDLFMDAVKRNVAFVVGTAFYFTPERGRHKARLNFSHPENDKIPIGIKKLASVIEEHIKKAKK
jgi:2-aminoadipate transaminase